MLPLEEARSRILSCLQPVGSVVSPLPAPPNSILASPITAPIDLPSFDNSAMDGYAVQAADLTSASPSNPVLLSLLGRIPAGEAPALTVSRGTCIRIFTGSPLPQGADAVAMQEDTLPSPPNQIAFLDRVKPWENVRFRGDDIQRGQVVLAPGEPINAFRHSLLAALGFNEVRISRKVKVSLLATGSELRAPGQPLQPGQIHESNRAGLAALITQAGGEPALFPLVKDDLDATVQALRQAFETSDAVITSGGASVGDHDFIKPAFEQLGGKLEFWKVAIKPGKPFIFGSCSGKPFFGLPGNPVSAIVTFLLLVRPALLRMQNANSLFGRTHPGMLEQDLANDGDRRHFMRVRINDEGKVKALGSQGSHNLGSLAQANALIDVPPHTTLKAGTVVAVTILD